jgi:ABC-type Zn2+ transport system substrate-binding protein/surface adhesin
MLHGKLLNTPPMACLLSQPVYKTLSIMKKQFLKIVTLLLFATVAISSCSVEYRQHRQYGHDYDHDHHDDRHDDEHHY